MKYPPVHRYGDINAEDFEAYFARWPEELAAIPKQVVQDWIHRHWDDFSESWIDLAPHNWQFRSELLSNSEILSIDHIGTWIRDLDAEGREYVSGGPRGQTRLAQYMLRHGTSPVPIIVARNAGHIMHPRGAREAMKEPLQLIEGHCRLACLRGMINTHHSSLAVQHRVWVASIP